MFWRRLPLTPLALSLVGWVSGLLAQVTWYVATNGVDNAETGRGRSWDLPYATISNALMNAADGDEILVSNGAFQISTTLNVNKAVKLRSVGGWEQTLIIGNGTHRIIDILANNALVSGFTITNGYLDASGQFGAGVRMTASAILSNCMIIGNTVVGDYRYGGGVYCCPPLNGTTLVSHCIIQANRAYFGAGISLTGRTDRTVIYLVHSVIVDNLATNANSVGGGVWLGGATVIVAGCTISGNVAAVYGGGIYVHTSGRGEVTDSCLIGNVAYISNTLCGGGGYCSESRSGMSCRYCNFQGNTTPANGGGILFLRCSDVVENCIMRGNCQTYSETGRGGAAVCLYGGGTVRNCLIVGNSNSASVRCAVQFYGYTDTTGVLENCTIVSNTAGVNYYASSGNGLVRNTIIYDNIFTNYIADARLTFDYCCTMPLPTSGVGNIASDPVFVKPASGDYCLQSISPCRDMGINQSWMNGAVDLVGRSRLDGFRRQVDMGCYEFLPSGAMIRIR